MFLERLNRTFQTPLTKINTPVNVLLALLYIGRYELVSAGKSQQKGV